MFFKGSGKFITEVATHIEMHTGRPIFEEMYIVYDNNGNFNFTGKPDDPRYHYNIKFYVSNGGNFLQVAGDRWISASKVRDHLYKFVFADQCNDPTAFSVVPFSGAVCVFIPGDASGLVGNTLEYPYFAAYSPVMYCWKPQYELPPLSRYVSGKNYDYSGLEFTDSTLPDYKLDEIKMTGCMFDQTEFYGVSMKRSFFAGASFKNCTSKDKNDFSNSDFSNCNFTGASFNRGDCFAGAVFSKAILNDADFRGAVLTGVNLGSAQLENTDFRGADLSYADLSHADLRYIKIDHTTKLKNANLSFANLKGLDLTGLDLTRTDFSNSELGGNNFTGTILIGTDFLKTDLTDCVFDDYPKFSASEMEPMTCFHSAKIKFDMIKRKWSYIDLSYATIADLPIELSASEGDRLEAVGTVLTGIDLSGRKIKYANFKNVNLRGARMNGSDLSYSAMQGAILGGDDQKPGAYLYGAKLFDVDLSHSILSGADFSYALFYGKGSTVTGATMPCTKFKRSFMAGMEFSDVKDMRGVCFDNACLLNCDFSGCRMTPYDNIQRSSFQFACIQGAVFSGAMLDGAVMQYAFISDEPGSIKVCLGDDEEIQWNFQKTIISESVTGAKTICPDGDFGPCTIKKLHTKKHTDRWPVEEHEKPPALDDL
jgi:uncharacterized protein YjbI with pentapeptide repeats